MAEICEVTWWWRGPDFLWETEDCWLSAKCEEVPNSDPEVRDLVSVHPVSVRTHDSDNYTDGCNKTSNTSEDRHSQNFKLCISLLFSSFVELFLKYFEPNCCGGTIT